MLEEEFKKLQSKNQWRDRFAVWINWNINGEYLTYKIPKGEKLAVWRGRAASQQLKDSAGKVILADEHGNSFWIDGGAEQIVVNPDDLKPKNASRRLLTGWGYDEDDIEVNLIGVPILKTNWREPEKTK